MSIFFTDKTALQNITNCDPNTLTLSNLPASTSDSFITYESLKHFGFPVPDHSDTMCKCITTQLPQVDRIIFNNPATVVFWTDGTKTVVKCMEGQEFSEYYGFLAALAKKVYGTNSAVKRIVKNKGN